MSELIKIAARLARREGLPDETPASVFNWLGAESIAIRNEADKQRALIETLSKTLSAVKTWAEKRCPCENDDPNPCPLCGASVENLEACKAVDQTFPPNIKRDIFAALAAAKEQSA